MKIKKELVERLSEISKSAYPNEVAGLLLKTKDVIDDFVIMPGESTTFQVNVQMHMLPIYPNAAGTFHCHPSSSNSPSTADLRFFTTVGRTHIIICLPYSFNSMAAYDTKGKPVSLEVVE